MLQRSPLVPSLLLRSRPAMAAAKHTSPVQTEDRCFVAESAGSDLVYFTLSGPSERGPSPHARPRCFLPRPGRCFSFCVPAAEQNRRGRVWAARLHRDLQRSLSRAGLLGTEIWALLSYSPRDEAAALERGFLIRDGRRGPEAERAVEGLLRLHLPAPAHLSVYEEAEGGEVWRWLWRLEGAAGGKELLSHSRVVAVEEPRLHPAAAHLIDTAVFGSLEAARGVLEECTSLIPEAGAILDLVDKCPVHKEKGDFPVIVIEGLDATGKTTVTHALKDSLNAVLLRSPPPCVSQWRKIFDDEPTLIRRAFYALTNYIVASEIAKASIKSPVIVDRYWHSTAAYAIATEISGKVQNLPPPHHPVYCWPKDLLKPDVVLLLTVSSDERIRRLQGRGIEETKEEAELERNRFFRQKVEESYRRMENPTCQPVDASPSREEVLKVVLNLIKKQCDLL